MNYERFENNDTESIGNRIRSDLKQLYLLLWKNVQLQKRSILGTMLEILVPALFAIILLPIRHIVKSNQYLNDTTYMEFSIDQFPSTLFPIHPDDMLNGRGVNEPIRGGSWYFAYQPNDSVLINSIMEQVGKDLLLDVVGFGDEKSMETYLADPLNNWIRLAGVSFLNQSLSNFTYKLRFSSSPRNSGQLSLFKTDIDWKTNLIYSLFPVLGPRDRNGLEGGDPGYYREGFIQVQKSIDFALIAHTTNNSKIKRNVALDLKRFPYPPYDDDKFVAIIAALFPFIIIISFIFTVILTAKAIVYEKETGIKEAMKLMGMKTWIYWLSWYIKTLVLLLPSLLFMIIAYKIKVRLTDGGIASIINKTDPILFAIFFLLYASSSITFTFMCSTFFKTANMAAAGTGVIWFFSYLPYIFISLRYVKMNLFEKLIALLVNNLALSEGVQLIAMFEGKGTGINFSNWTHGLTVDDNFAMIMVMSAMVLNSFIYMALTVYFDNIFPGKHGLAKPWYFPIKCLVNRRNSANLEYDVSILDESEANKDLSTIRGNNALHENDQSDNAPIREDETVYSGKNIGIKIMNLSKQFMQLGRIKRAVKNLSLNIYEGQISVLLGHNGAGKSTTISMITGLCEPSNGQILINDKDIVKQTKSARKFLGYCPQHNLLFDDLTVYEHLKFFSKLKENFNEAEIDSMLEIINLADKKHTLSKTLSGGMKRKLSVAIAFIGNSKIVILDEPSSGMDPQARHSTWSLLQKFKKERQTTILLTTHFMDEADFLGDRIAIMSKGSLKCCGSPLFLKSKYGSGYNLVLAKKKQEVNDLNSTNEANESQRSVSMSSNAVSSKILDIVKKFIPNAKLNSNISSEISFVLPTEDSDKFAALFECLESEKEELNIVNIGISVTTIEDVFLNIAEEENIEEDVGYYNNSTNYSLTNPAFNQSEQNNGSINESGRSHQSALNNDEFATYGLWIGSRSEDLVHGFEFLMKQFNALIKKRFIHSIRNKTLVIFQLLIPTLVLINTLLVLKYGPIKAGDSPPLAINIERYSKNYVPIMANESSSVDLRNFIHYYKEQFNRTSNTQPFELSSTDLVQLCPTSRNEIDEFLKCLGRLSINYIVDGYVVALDVNETSDRISIVGHFNNQPYHVPPLAVNLISNSLMNFYSNSSTGRITVINHPLKQTLKDKITGIQLKDQTGFNVASSLTFGFAFLISSFAIFLIKERSSDSKHLQYLNGCNSNLFWISAFLWDMLNYMIPVITTFPLLAIFNIKPFIGNGRWVYVFEMMFLYGLAHIPQTYLLSYFFKVSSTGFAALVAWNILNSQTAIIAVSILALPELDLISVSKILEWVFLLIFPNFSYGQGMIDLYNNYQFTNICTSKIDGSTQSFAEACPFLPNPCCISYGTSPKRCGTNSTDDCLLWNKNYMAWEKPGLLRFYIFMLLQFLVQFSIVLFYEAGYFRKLKYALQKVFGFDKSEILIAEEQLTIEEQYGDIPKDKDVIDEEKRIYEMLYNQISNSSVNQSTQINQSSDDTFELNREIFIVDRLTKHYANFMAVKGISFSVRESDCFGLLGVNGAGKTSTFKMITGDTVITRGDAYIDHVNIKTDIKSFQKQLGYCPQFDPLIDQMTVYETMEMYANLRGIRSDLVKGTCLSLISLLDLNEHIEKMCYTLSGGNKRKLSVAIALVGSPIVVLLDEPTSGMDPKTRRVLWNCLNKIRNKGKSLILTTHSMDETEALCSNIGIMVNGELKCLGSLQHLKSKYGEGYTLLSKIALVDNNRERQTRNIDDFISFVLNEFKDTSNVKENRDGFINIHIDDNSATALSKIFSLVEANKSKYSIEYYVVTQTKLEQIFLNFASRQIDPETRIVSNNKSICC